MFRDSAPFRWPASLLALSLALLLVPPSPALAGKKKAEKDAERAATVAAPEATLAKARELLEADRPEEAVAVLDRYLEDRPKSAEGLLLRSTARIMTGELEAGRADLERSLDLDPTQRQGWLNLGAVHLADKRYADALKAFQKAEKLQPEAPENDLNIGAVLLLMGELEPASERFTSYLKGGVGGSAEGYYLVATNYAMAGYAALAVQHLKRAIALEERIRLRVRTDPNFADLRNRPELRELLATDPWRPPPGSYVASRTFDAPYRAGDGQLLKAVLDTLQLSSLPFDSRVEVTDDWALIWGDVRIKVTHGEEGRGKVEVSAEADRFTPTEWRERLKLLFGGIQQRLTVLKLRRLQRSQPG
jgi:tetratricopeptide (TPR) repeat protein